MLQEVTKLSSARSWQKMCLGKLSSTGVGSPEALCGGPDTDSARVLQGGCGNAGVSKGAQPPAAKGELPLVVFPFNPQGVLDKLSQEKY